MKCSSTEKGYFQSDNVNKYGLKIANSMTKHRNLIIFLNILMSLNNVK